MTMIRSEKWKFSSDMNQSTQYIFFYVKKTPTILEERHLCVGVVHTVIANRVT